MKRIKKILIWSAIGIVVVVAALLIFISPIAKYLVEKYGKKYTGREIKVSWAFVNPFTGYVHLSKLKIYEHQSDSLFLTAAGVSVNFGVMKLFRHGFEIKRLELDHPVIYVIRDHGVLNFDDVIERLSSKDTSRVEKKSSHSTQVNLLNLKVTRAEIHFTDKQIPFDYFIKEADFETKGIHWDEDTMSIAYSFLSGPTKGSMKGQFHVNFKTGDYLIADRIEGFDLKPLEQYVKDLVNYGTARAVLEADLLAKGNFHHAEDLVASGTVSLNDFHFGRRPGDDYMSFDKLKIAIAEISPINHRYLLNDIQLIKPMVRYEQYDHSDNLQEMFNKKGAASQTVNGSTQKLNILISIGRYIKALSNNFFRSDYKIDNLAIINGNLKYNDYTLNEEFSIGLQGLSIKADSLNKHHERVNVYVRSALQPYGNVSIKLSIDPNDSSYYDLNYHIIDVPVSMFNPYIITYTSYPLDRGTLELKGAWDVQNGSIHSTNHLVIVDPRASKRIRGKDKNWLPVPLIFAFIRERGDVIDYEIPITGRLKDPKFHFNDVVLHLLENIFVKPVTTPYRFEVRNAEKAIEKSLMIKWPITMSTLLPSQEKFLSDIAHFMSKNKDAKISVRPVEYTLKEKEHLGFFEAKKKYFLTSLHKSEASFSSDDSIAVERMSIRDKGFTRYLGQHVTDPLLFTLQEKCGRLISEKTIDQVLGQIEKKRKDALLSYFKKEGVEEGRVKMEGKKTAVPFDGFSYHEISYSGALPDQLLKAYQKMNELNYEQPRKKYLREHKKALP